MDSNKKKANTHLKGLITSLFNKKQEENKQDLKEEQHKPDDLQIDAEAKTGKEVNTETKYHKVRLLQEGSVWKLWQEWRKADPKSPARLPELYVDKIPEGHALLLNSREIDLEMVRIGTKLENWVGEQLKKLQSTNGGEPAPMDAQCWANVSHNGMMAWVFIIPPLYGGADIMLNDILKALAASSVRTGFETMLCEDAVKHKYYFSLLPVAWGIPVESGTNGRIIEHYPRKNVYEVKLDENGNVDYRAQQYVQMIRKDDVICDIIPQKEGKEGVQVTGHKVHPKPVKAARVPIGANTELNEEETQLRATMDGHLEFTGMVFQVKPLLEIKGDVDYSTGNIDFRGDVQINGDVRERFTVRATGTVTVNGLVEAATIEAKGSIVISRGVVGDNRALIKSRGTVRAKYLENCVVYSGECTFADCIISSKIYSDQRISVMTGRGTVIGGSITAALQVEAHIIGSQSGRKTEVVLGVLPYVQEEHRGNEVQLNDIEKEISQIEKKLSYLAMQSGSQENGKEIAQLNLQRSVLALKKNKLTKRQEELEGINVHLEQCRFECRTVYPGTLLTIGSVSRKFDNVWNHCTATLDVVAEELMIF